MHLLALSLPTVMLWIMGMLIGGLFFLIFVLFPILMFIAALIEPGRLDTFPPLEDALRVKPNPILDAALAAGFSFIGHYRYNNHGPLKAFCTAALSPDGIVLLQLRRGRGERHVLMTRFPTHWVLTASSSGSPDLTGLESIDTLPDATFPVLLQYHNSRLHAAPAKAIAFDLSTVLPALVQHDQEKMEAIVRRRLGRYINAERTAIRLNVSGAIQMVVKGMAQVISSARRIHLANQKNDQMAWGVKTADRSSSPTDHNSLQAPPH